MQHGMMLDVGGDYVVSAPPLPKGSSPEGGVVGLAPAAGEDHLAGPASQDAGHRLPGLIQRFPRLLGQHVQAGGITEPLGEVGKHGLHNLRANRRSGRVIHVYHTGMLLHRIRNPCGSHTANPSAGRSTTPSIASEAPTLRMRHPNLIVTPHAPAIKVGAPAWQSLGSLQTPTEPRPT